MHWKLEVQEYGKIEYAEIAMAPLTLFVGDNNSGKSYLLTLLWGIKNLGVEGLLGDVDGKPLKEEYLLMNWLREQIKVAWEKGSCICKVSQVADICQSILDKWLKRNKDGLVKKIFNSKDVRIKGLRLKLKGLEEVTFKIKRDRKANENSGFTFGNEQTQRFGRFYSSKKLLDAEEKIDRFMIFTVFSMVLDIDLAESNINSDIYLPSSRTGFMLTKDIINKVGRNTAFNIRMERETVIPFSRPINQFLDVINDLTADSGGNKKFREITQYLESGMAEGTLEISARPNKELSYVPAGDYIPAGRSSGLPLRVVSAVVTELSPLILILKHKECLHTLFYEEPEMCLHPQLQHKMAKVICRMVNCGLVLAITTHSDIILQHINNMIRLSGREEQNEICQELGYSSEELLQPQQVKVYQLKSRPEGKTTVEELKCGQNGFVIPTFNEALDKIMDEAYRIQE